MIAGLSDRLITHNTISEHPVHSSDKVGTSLLSKKHFSVALNGTVEYLFDHISGNET